MTGIIGGEYGLGWVRRQVIITTAVEMDSVTSV